MKKFLFIAGMSMAVWLNADPGIMIDIEVIIDRPSGPGEVVMAAICK